MEHRNAVERPVTVCPNTSIAGTSSKQLGRQFQLHQCLCRNSTFFVQILLHSSSQQRLFWKSTDHTECRKCIRQVNNLKYPNYNHTTSLVTFDGETFWFPCWLKDQEPNTVIRGSELLMARPTGWKLSFVVFCRRTSFLCGSMDPISQCAQLAGCFHHSHLSDCSSDHRIE